MEYSSSYRQTDMYPYLNEIHFSRIFQLMTYYEKTPDNDKRLCLEILKIGSIDFNGQPTSIKLYDDLLDKFPDLVLEFYELDDLYNFVAFTSKTFAQYRWHFPADNYNMLRTLLALGVSDLVIDEPLTFDIENVANIVRTSVPECRIHIRPDIGKPGWMDKRESIIHHFWLLPQYVYLYEDYVDVIDLFAEAPPREMRLIESFCIKKTYDYELNAFVLHSAEGDEQMRGSLVSEEMAYKRMRCKQKCMSTYPSRCHECDIDLDVYRMLQLGRHKPQSQS